MDDGRGESKTRSSTVAQKSTQSAFMNMRLFELFKLLAGQYDANLSVIITESTPYRLNKESSKLYRLHAAS